MCKLQVGLVQDGTSSSPDDSRGQTAELQPCAGPSSGSTKLGGEGQSGHPQAPAPQGETAGRADLFNSQELAGNLTGPPQVNMLACESAQKFSFKRNRGKAGQMYIIGKTCKSAGLISPNRLQRKWHNSWADRGLLALLLGRFAFVLRNGD